MAVVRFLYSDDLSTFWLAASCQDPGLIDQEEMGTIAAVQAYKSAGSLQVTAHAIAFLNDSSLSISEP